MAAVKKVVVKLDLQDDTRKRKAIKAVSALCGIDQIAVDMKDDKITVVGAVDPVDVVRKLRNRFCTVQMVSVGPAKEEDKPKASVAPAKGGEKDASTAVPPCCPPHCYCYPHPCYFVHPEENPSACVIC